MSLILFNITLNYVILNVTLYYITLKFILVTPNALPLQWITVCHEAFNSFCSFVITRTMKTSWVEKLSNEEVAARKSGWTYVKA